MEILSNYALEIFFGLISAGALAFCRSVFKKNKELEGLMQENRNRQVRQMILDEIEPIVPWGVCRLHYRSSSARYSCYQPQALSIPS